MGTRRRGRGNRQDNQSAAFFRCFRLLGRVAGLIATGAAVASGAASALTDVPIGPIAEVMLGALAAGLLGFHLVNLELRLFLEHWTIEGLRRPLYAEVVLGCGVPAGILAAIFNSRPSWSLLVAISLALLATYGIYEPVQETIQREVKRHHLPQGTYYFGSLRPLGFVGIDKDIATIAKDEHWPNLQALLAFFVGKPWLGGLSRTRTLILCALLIGFGAAAAAAAEVRLQEAVRPDPAPTVEPETAPAAEASGASIQGAATTSAGAFESEAVEEAGECSSLPGDGAPAWAQADLNALYLGGRDFEATPPPGFEVGGCTSGAIVRDRGRFVFAVGRSPSGEISSVAVTSRRFGPAIFLAPAAQRVLVMIEAGRLPVGGYPRLDVAGGDIVPVLTPNGTVVLVRATKHPPGQPRYATPYVELPATVAMAWMGALNELDIWLWPTTPFKDNDFVLFSLQGETEAGHLKLDVSYDPRTGIARRGPYTYRLPQEQLNPTELEEHAETASSLQG